MKGILSHLVSGETLRVEQAVEAFRRVMDGEATPAQVGAMLSMIQLRSPTVHELVGAARVMREKASRVEVPDGLTVVDTCGTGGDGTGTFNISTAAAIVSAGAGRARNVVVAKHGNRSVTSKSGSSQVFEVLGVKLLVSSDTLTRCLSEAGLCFCYAPAHHPAMKHVAPVRQELGFRTIFNLLGPLTNPAQAKRQVIGVFSPDLTEPIAHVLQELGSEHAMVVHGLLSSDSGLFGGSGLDEMTISGINRVSHLRDGRVSTYEVDPASLGLSGGSLAGLRVEDPESSARIIRGVLAGQPGPARDIVCLNASAALVVAGVAAGLEEGLVLAARAIDSGEAAGVLEKLVEVTQADQSVPQ